MEILLTRQQLEQVLTLLALNDKVSTVKITEQSLSGIGPTVTAYFYNAQDDLQHKLDITDVSTW